MTVDRGSVSDKARVDWLFMGGNHSWALGVGRNWDLELDLFHSGWLVGDMLTVCCNNLVVWTVSLIPDQYGPWTIDTYL